MWCHRSHRLRTILPSKVVSLISSWLESTLIEAKVVVSFTCIGSLGFWDAATNFIRVSKLVESLVVGRLEVIVDHTTLLLLSKWEVVTFKFSFQNAIFLLLSLWVLVLLKHKLILSFRDCILSLMRANLHTCCFHLRTNFTSICGLSTFLSLCINRRRIESFRSFIWRPKTELSGSHASLKFLSVLELVFRDRKLTLVSLVDRYLCCKVIP